MKRMITKSLGLLALVGAMTAYSSSKAEAALSLNLCTTEFCVGGTTIIVTDGGAGDANPADGAITYIGGFAGFSAASVNSAFGVPEIGTPGAPQLDLHFSASGAGDGFLYAVQGPYGAPDPGKYSLSFGGTTTGSVSVQGIVGDSFADAQTVGPFTGDFSGSMALTHPAPYTQVIGVHIVQGAGGISTGDLHLVPVPEPLSLSLLGLGLAGVAMRRRQRA
jgi:hypothetical protein